MDEEITITLGGADGFVNVAFLIDALENTLEILRGLEARFLIGERIQWEVVRASMRSPLSLTLAPVSHGPVIRSAGRNVARAMTTGFRQISSTASLPRYFDEKSLLAAKKLVEHAEKRKTTLTFSMPNEEPVTPTLALAENVKQVVSQARTTHEVGTIEGKLEGIWTHGQDSFFVWELLTLYKVKCFATPEQLEAAKSYLRRRVAVTGRIAYRLDRPVSMRVHAMSPLRIQDELPQPDELGRIDITGGVSSEDYVRGLRDGE